MLKRSFAYCLAFSLCLPITVFAAPPKKSNSPTSIGGQAKLIYFRFNDPKRPDKLLFEVWAASASGQSLTSGQTGTLTNIKAILYEKGVKSAVMTAPLGQADGIRKITASGGVFVRSLTQPGTSVAADRMVWYAAKNQYGANPILVASGNVIAKNKEGAEVHAPVMYADTILKKISTNRPGRAVIRKGGKS